MTQNRVLMRLLCLNLAASLFFLGQAFLAQAAEQPGPVGAKTGQVQPLTAASGSEMKGLMAGLDKSIFLDLRDINVVDVLKFLAIEGSLNIVTSKNVQGRSTLLLSNVKIRDALDIIVLSNQLAYNIRNGIIYISTEEEFFQMFGKNFNDQKHVVTRTLKYAKPSYVLAALQAVRSAIWKVILD